MASLKRAFKSCAGYAKPQGRLKMGLEKEHGCLYKPRYLFTQVHYRARLPHVVVCFLAFHAPSVISKRIKVFWFVQTPLNYPVIRIHVRLMFLFAVFLVLLADPMLMFLDLKQNLWWRFSNLLMRVPLSLIARLLYTYGRLTNDMWNLIYLYYSNIIINLIIMMNCSIRTFLLDLLFRVFLSLSHCAYSLKLSYIK